MTVLHSIEEICKSIPNYSFIFEEARLMNTRADDLTFPCIYFEEYRTGSYTFKYVPSKVTRVQLYFSKLVPMQSDAVVREQLREEIEQEAVLPFIKLYNASNKFRNVEQWKFLAPPPRWDANEVSIMIEFDCIINVC